MSIGFGNAVFDWGFVSVMTSRSVIVLAIANTLGSLFPGRISRLWAAFLASLIVTVYAAYQGGWSWRPSALFEVLAFAFILFCITAGMNQSARAVGRRITAGRGAAEGARPEAARAGGGGAGWWASWF
jgi:hypothetical protein